MSHDNTSPHTEFKRCPYCAEEIKAEAILCKHCGSSLDDKDITEGHSETYSKTLQWLENQAPTRDAPIGCAFAVVGLAVGLPTALLFGLYAGFVVWTVIAGFGYLLDYGLDRFG